jgi:NAD(P)-dependent dehydrogenase (short-subunit alcohol dehydrogenase family)
MNLSSTPGRGGSAFIVGAGDATGSAIAKAFAREGYFACVARRNGGKLAPLVESIQASGGKCRAFTLDARKEEAVAKVVDQIEQECGPIEVFCHNIGANIMFPICDTTSRKYFKVWEIAAFSAFLTGREVARRMVMRERGTMIFTGATASVRGSANFAAFAGAMHAKSALAASMARELGPRGIHVAHIVIDGAIETEFVEGIMNSRAGPGKYEEALAKDGILRPAAIAENYVHLHRQPKNAWTFELDLRPWVERW